VNKIDFSSGGHTITMTQSTAPGIRAMTGVQNQIQFTGSHNGTISHAAISQNLGFFRETGSTRTLTITNAYSFLINPLDDYGAGFTFTNRWGIYQAGASDKNYFAANVLLGSTTDGGQRLQVQGTSLLNGNTSIQSIAGNTTQVENATFIADTLDFIITGGRGNNSAGTLLVSTTISSFGTNFGGTKHLINVAGNFQPGASANGNVHCIGINTTINYPVGALGIQRGLYVNPTLTRVTDWRAIEVVSGISILAPSTTASATLRVPSGTAPTTPTNGDIWFDGTNLFMRIGGVTKTFTII